MVSNPIRRVTTADIHHHLGEIFGRDVETAGIEGYRALAVAMVLDIAQELVEHPLIAGAFGQLLLAGFDTVQGVGTDDVDVRLDGLLSLRERHVGQHIAHQAVMDGDGLGILMGEVDEHGLAVEVIAQLHGHAVLGRDVIDRFRKGDHQNAAVLRG